MSNKVKEKIRTNFNKAACSYDQHCAIQNEVCKKSIELLLTYQNHFNHIADFACGTGESTLRLTHNVHYEKCYAIDFAESLLTVAEKKLTSDNKINFIQGDLDEQVLKVPCLDLIFCNMGLQWAASLSRSIALFHQYLISEGMLIFSMPIDGNFPEIKAPLKLTLPNHETIIQTLRYGKFELIEFDIKILPITFINQFELLKSLKGVGANYNKSENSKTSGLSKLKANKIFTISNNTMLTYNIGIYLARKK